MKDKYNKDKGFFIKAGWYAEEDQKQIEEMAKHGCYDGCASGLRKFCDEYDGKPCKNMVRIASGLYEQGYRKLPKDSVVLTTEELKDMVKARTKCVENAIIRTRKETAEKILNDLVGHTFEDDGWTWTVSKEDIQWLADEYKVEIKE